jgi:DNA-binding HxlR family transcriptional regulator
VAKRAYGQYCCVAAALDVVGERWTLLLVRELLPGPRRYKDLLANLPGISAGLLSARLKALEAEGIVRRTVLPPPASVTAYELTDAGRELQGAITSLGRWGLRWVLREPQPDDVFRPGWAVTGMNVTFRPEAARGVHETYEFRIDGEVFHARVDDGTVATAQGPAWRPDLVVTTDSRTFLASAAGRLPRGKARRAIATEGDAAAATRCLEIFGLPLTIADAAAARA